MAKGNLSASPAKATKQPSLLEVFEKLVKVEESLQTILSNQDSMKKRLDCMEGEMSAMKTGLEVLEKKELENATKLAEQDGKLEWQYDMIKNAEFELVRQEQYSRKASVRILGVEEKEGEVLEAVCINLLKDEIGVDITSRDIEIVHRTGRRREDRRPRAILLKCLSHKTKSEIMVKKKTAKNIRIFEDLAFGIKKMLDEVVRNKQRLNVESIWTIDGKLKFKFIGEERVNYINCNNDYVTLMSRLRHH